jgi:hypothetical protein
MNCPIRRSWPETDTGGWVGSGFDGIRKTKALVLADQGFESALSLNGRTAVDVDLLFLTVLA